MGRPYRDLTGIILNNVKYLHPIEGGGSGQHKYWVCVCPFCKKEFTTKRIGNFGCPDCVRHRKIDRTSPDPIPEIKPVNYIGQIFGCYTVVGRSKYTPTNWVVKCECGKENIIDISTLNHARENNKKCDCSTKKMSIGERKIQNYLQEHKIEYQREYKIDGLVGKNNNNFRFDYYLPKLNIMIEFDGKQHFQPCYHFDGYDATMMFYELVNRDIIKEDYCYSHNIKLIRIAYYENVEQRLDEEIVCPT